MRADLPVDAGKAEIVAGEEQGCTRDGRTGVLAVACMQGEGWAQHGKSYAVGWET